MRRRSSRCGEDVVMAARSDGVKTRRDATGRADGREGRGRTTRATTSVGLAADLHTPAVLRTQVTHTHTTTGRKTLLKGADTYLAVELLHGILGIADVVILDEGEARRAASDPNLADGAEGTELILKREG